MPYYKEKNLLFIHIPKTGGTMIEKAIKNNQTLYTNHKGNKLLVSPYNKTSLQHQFYTTIYQFRDKLKVDFDNIKVFTIVRNPYNRIISDLFWNRLIKINFTSDEVYNVIKNNYLYRDDLDSHNEPQYKFIVDENCKLIESIKIFQTEELNEINDELNKFIGFNIDIKRNKNKDYNKYLNKESISLINDFYKKDFELFNYEFRQV
jgi:hypothetical protein